MKHCNSCETDKDESEFGNRKASLDGLAAKCRTCQKVYDKARAKDPAREEARRIYQQTDEGKLLSNKAKANYRKRNPNKYRAHNLVNSAIRRGSLFKEPCEKCGYNEVHAHHDDYSKPLNIRWLCNTHHRSWHAENGEALNP